MPPPYDFTLAADFGWSRFDDSSGNYEDYSVGISKEYVGFGFDLSFSCSDEDACSAPVQCGGNGVFTVSKSVREHKPRRAGQGRPSQWSFRDEASCSHHQAVQARRRARGTLRHRRLAA